jgi:sugar phosphate isomerase/epimerase
MLNRRDLLKAVPLGLATLALGASENPPHITFPDEPRKRIAVASYPFRAFIEAPGNHDRDSSKPGMDLSDFAKRIPTEFGVSGIEPLSTHFVSTDRDYVKRLRSAFDAAGVHTVNIPVDFNGQLCSEDLQKRKVGVATYARWIDTAVILRSPSIRINAPRCDDITDVVRAAQGLKPVVDYGARHNIIINLENDDPHFESAKRIAGIVQQLNNPYLRALPDFANALAGGDETFNAESVRTMFRFAFNIAHTKDAEEINGKVERVNLASLFAIAKASGYRGYYSMESDSPVDPYIDTKHLIQASISLM